MTQPLTEVDVAGLTCDLIAAASENPGGAESAAVDVLRDALEAIGARVSLDEVEPNRPNLFARIGADRPGGILFLGHSDVVPAGDGWSGDPFVPRRTDTEIIGRGATDMKGGLAAVVAAMAQIHRMRPELPVSLLCTVDEELDARGILHHLAARPRHQFDACVVAEPTDLSTIIGCRGAANFRITVNGASAHAGRPSDGASAILAAAEVIAAIESDAQQLAVNPHPFLGTATWNVGRVVGGQGPSIVPDGCELEVDRRLLPAESAAEVLTGLLEVARERIAQRELPHSSRIHLDGKVEMFMPGFVTAPEHPLVNIAIDAARAVGAPGESGVWTASCEGGFAAQYYQVPTIVLGPGDITGQAHQPDERVCIRDLHAAVDMFTKIAMRVEEDVAATTNRSNNSSWK